MVRGNMSLALRGPSGPRSKRLVTPIKGKGPGTMRVVPGLCGREVVRCGVRQVVARLPSGRKVFSCHLHKPPNRIQRLEELQVQAKKSYCSDCANSADSPMLV